VTGAGAAVLLAVGGFLGVAVSPASAATTGTVKGTVDAGGAPAAGICVYAVPSSGNGTVEGPATTASNGKYTLTVDTGSWDIEFTDGCGQTGEWATQYYPGVFTTTEASAITVASGATVSAIGADLQAAGSLSGTVTAAATSADLSGICVQATGEDLQAVGLGTTGSDGTYSITGLPADLYSVEFSTGCGNSGNFESQWYNNETSQFSADPVTVTANANTPSIDAAMTAGATISGTVRDASTSDPVAGLCVEATGEETDTIANATTAIKSKLGVGRTSDLIRMSVEMRMTNKTA